VYTAWSAGTNGLVGWRILIFFIFFFDFFLIFLDFLDFLYFLWGFSFHSGDRGCLRTDSELRQIP
jgi:hypothetical protein